MRISKETPVGVIDGNNQIFTTLNPIQSIDDIWIDGAIYVGYTFIGNVITLSDAPTGSIFIDYDTTDTIISISSDTTLGNIKERVWQQLGQKSTNISGIVTTTSTNFSNSIVEREINIVSNDVWRGKIINPITGRVQRAGKLFWQESMYSFRTNTGGTITSAVSIGDTTISIVTDNLNTTGYILLGGDVIKYTGKTLTTIIGVSGIQKSHISGEEAEQVYQMPINYDIITGLVRVYNNEEIDINYKVMRDGEVPLLRLPKDNIIIKTYYITKYVSPSSDTDSFPFPDMYGESVIADIVAGRLAYPKGLPQAERLLQMGFQALSGMYMFYSKDIKDLNTKILPQLRQGRRAR